VARRRLAHPFPRARRRRRFLTVSKAEPLVRRSRALVELAVGIVRLGR